MASSPAIEAGSTGQPPEACFVSETAVLPDLGTIFSASPHTETLLKHDNIGQPDFAGFITLRAPVIIFERPLEPLEPVPYSLSALEWGEYIIKRDAARDYAAENDLRGTF